MPEKIITSLDNQRVKDAAKLRDHRQRKKQDRIVIDGAREIARALQAGVPLTEVFVCEPLLQTEASRQVVKELSGARLDLWHVSPDVFARLAFGERAEGIVAIAPTPRRKLTELELPDRPLIAVLERVEKPGNVGAVLRSADAAGVAAVIVADGRTDLYNPNCIRASLGAIFSVPACEASSAETIAWVKQRGWPVFAARVDAKAIYTDVNFTGGAALVLGSEAEGLSAAWRSPVVIPIRLPLLGRVDSLNVSATAAVLFYEAQRQCSAAARAGA